jgi:hypothetical protein
MDKRINKLIETHTTNFKANIKSRALQLDVSNNPNMISLIQYICDYERLYLNKEDFMKRKRAKNSVKITERCSAKRANGEQCTRRRKDELEYCGTHLKGTPHGICEDNHDTKQTSYKIEVWAEDIRGIIYYIDKQCNVYQTEDIISNKNNPKIIAKYVKNKDNMYSIPAFNI